MPSKFNTKIGDVIYKHTLQQKIGGGNFGEVWLAHDEAIDQDVAIKLLDPSKTSIIDELQEAQMGHRMDHPNLVKVHYADVTKHNGDDIVVLSMDYLPRGSVLSGLNSANFVPMNDALHIITDVLRGLEFLHEQGVYHNDIKPQNILIGDAGEGKLTDYGISSEAQYGQAAQAKGAYVFHAAPEVIANGQIDAQTDVYQVGLTLFRLLNGVGILEEKYNRLGRDKFYETVTKGNLIKPTDYLPFIPRTLKRVLNKAIRVDPTKRYQSALEMRRALEKLMFPGCWTTDEHGIFIGADAKCRYRFEVTQLDRDCFNLTSYKANKISGRETKIAAFTKKKLTKNNMVALANAFMLKIAEG